MIPIRDDNPVRGIPVVTILTILACMAVYLWQISLPLQSKQTAITLLGFMPALLFGHGAIEGQAWVSPAGSIFTAMFLHGGFFHLAGNMLYLWIFGDNVEDRVGRGRFVAFYLICGAIAALTQALPDTCSTVPMIGASGAVSGVLGAIDCARHLHHAYHVSSASSPSLAEIATILAELDPKAPAITVGSGPYRHGGSVEITDFAPRWRRTGRFYRPVMLVRRLRRRQAATPVIIITAAIIVFSGRQLSQSPNDR